MTLTHEMILVGGLLGLLSIFAAMFSVRFGTPLLLVFIGVGMLAGEDGPGGIRFDDFQLSYLIGSLALAVILFEGGLNLQQPTLRRVLWPSILLATVGVAVSAALVGGAIVLLFPVPWPIALLAGATVAPTDAAAVAILRHLGKLPVPARVVGLLELESGLNDPMSVFLAVGLVEYLLHPAVMTTQHALLLFAEEMGGGLVIGLAGGYAMRWLLHRAQTLHSVAPILALSGALLLFGGAQSIGASGFLAVYLAGGVVGARINHATASIKQFFDPLGWLAQICLFLMLGLLVTPSELQGAVLPALVVAAVLIFFARPVAVALCLLPFRWPLRESAFVAWVGLRGAVPIYLTIIPVLSNIRDGTRLFGVVFVIVIASVAIQGWSIGPMARLLRLQKKE